MPLLRSSPTVVRRLVVFVGAVVAVTLSCSDFTGPDRPRERFAQGIAFTPIFPGVLPQTGGASTLVTYDRVRIVLRRTDGTIALDTVVAYTGVEESISLNLSVALSPNAPATGEPMTLTLAYVNAVQDTVFRGGPVTVLVRPGTASEQPTPPVVPLSYSGIGSAATSVVIAPNADTVFNGDPFSFGAVAQGPGGPIPGTPIAWMSLDPTIATVTAIASGSGLAGNVRGSARIVAQLLNGPADTVSVSVLLKPSTITVISGSGQSANVGTALPQPLVVRVTAIDGIGVANVAVNFSAASGNGSVTTATATTDQDGYAQTTWQLGMTVGGQSVTVTAAGVSGAIATFNATAMTPPPTQLALATQPGSTIAGVPFVVAVRAIDANGQTATGFTGQVTLAFGNNPTSATLNGITSTNAVAGVATFAGLTITRAGAGYSLIITGNGVGSVATGAFNINPAAPASIVADAGMGQLGSVGLPLLAPFVARLSDAFGNATPGIPVTWTVVAGGGAIAPATSTADATGRARSTLTVGPVAGLNTVSAVVAGIVTPAVFNASGLVAGASSLAFVTQPSSVTAGIPIAPGTVVQARDALGNVVPGFTGTITISIGTNPGTSTLIGTPAVAAVAGVATHANLRLNKVGAGYTLIASSPGLANAVSAPFTVTPAPPIAITADSGNGQFGAILLPVPVQPVVLATDSLGNPAPGAPITWSVFTGGGLLSGSTLVTDITGRARTSFTLGGVLGFNAVQATSAGLAGSPVLFTVTALPVLASKLWTGATSTAWADATNWSPVGVPLATDSVFIQPITNQPVLAAAATVRSLTLGVGATLTLAGNIMNVLGGTLDAGTTISGGTVVVASGTGASIKGVVNGTLVVNAGSYTLSGATTVTGSMQIGGGGTVVVNGNTLTVNGNFNTTSTGVLNMTNAADVVAVSGDATFGGGATTGQLSAGTLSVGGNFTQANATSALSFVTTTGHTLLINGSGAQTITFATPDTVTLSAACAASCMGNITVNKTAGTLDFLSAASARGAMTISAGSTVNAIGSAGNPRVITVGGATSTAATVHFTRFRTTGNVAFGGATTIDSIGFSGTPAQTVAAGTYGEVTFLGSPTIAGDIVTTGNVTVANGAVSTGILNPNGNKITIGGGLSTTNGGIIFMANVADSIVTTTFANFSGGPSAPVAGFLIVGGNFVQTGTNTFTPVGSNRVVLNGAGVQVVSFADPVNNFFRRLFVEKAGGGVVFATNARVNGVLRASTSVAAASPVRVVADTVWGAVGSTLTAFVVEINRVLADSGVFSPDTTVFNDVGTGHTILPTHAGLGTNVFRSIRANMSSNTAQFGTGLALLNDLVVNAGSLTIGGNQISVAGHLKTQGTGTLVMSNAGDSLGVGLDAVFAGASTAGNLTDGVITIGGSFAQAGANDAFAPSLNHRVKMDGAAPALHVISFGNSTSSFFRKLFLDKPAGLGEEILLMSAVTVTDSLVVQNRTRLTTNGTLRLTVNGLFIYNGTGVNGPIVQPHVLEVTNFAPQMDSSAILAPRFFPDTLVLSGTANYSLPFANYVALKSVRIATTGNVDMPGTVGSNDTLSADMHVQNGRFRMQSAAATVFQKLRITNTGILEMTAGGPQLTVRDSALFGGGNQLNLMTSGTLRLEGHLVQTNANSNTSFHGDPPHVTQFAGTGLQTVNFASGGFTPAFSHFGNLQFSNPVGVTLQSNVFTHVLFDNTVGTQETILGNGFIVNAEGLNVVNLLFNNARLSVVDNNAITAFNTVTFTNFPTNPDIFTISRTAPVAATFTGLTFPIAGFTGRFLVANDPDGATSGVFTATLTGATPAAPGTQCLRSNGALISWNGTNVVTC